MVEWKNLDTLNAFQELAGTKGSVVLKEALAGEAGGDRVRKYRIPMAEGCRSLNLCNSVAIVLYEALRQNGFPGLQREGALHHHSWDNVTN